MILNVKKHGSLLVLHSDPSSAVVGLANALLLPDITGLVDLRVIQVPEHRKDDLYAVNRAGLVTITREDVMWAPVWVMTLLPEVANLSITDGRMRSFVQIAVDKA